MTEERSNSPSLANLVFSIFQHIQSSSFLHSIEEQGGDPNGWPTPHWSPLASKLLMQHVGARTAFAFFLSLPNIPDTKDALAEIAYGINTFHADGPIWTELNMRGRMVFVHPTHPVDTNSVNSKLPQPAIDYPHETTSLPYIISRFPTPMKKAPDFVVSHLMGTTHDKSMYSFPNFHFDLTLSSSPQVLEMLLKMVPHGRILYGSDFPYAPATAYPAFLEASRMKGIQS
ncbi:hypothetical protein BJX96DRAFT_167248 [Aspergillus floccosus]